MLCTHLYIYIYIIGTIDTTDTTNAMDIIYTIGTMYIIYTIYSIYAYVIHTNLPCYLLPKATSSCHPTTGNTNWGDIATIPCVVERAERHCTIFILHTDTYTMICSDILWYLYVCGWADQADSDIYRDEHHCTAALDWHQSGRLVTLSHIKPAGLSTNIGVFGSWFHFLYVPFRDWDLQCETKWMGSNHQLVVSG